tara:strand:+ start:6209 stop:6610 length:402 start_codon:yes stop_codon:yes gene_type:complete
MISPSEVSFIQDLLVELRSLTDEPSDYLAEEVDQAIDILDSLKKYDTSEILTLIESTIMNDQEMMDYAEQLVAGYDAATQTFNVETEAFVSANVPDADSQASIKALANDLLASRMGSAVVEACDPEVAPATEA